jgi:peptidoglycan/xylan/chitin deacetylase (PgdA/CDA1 family)
MVKRAILHLCKWLGLFQVAFLLTRGRLRILCYHGFALADEAEFRPRLFIRPETFQQRIRYLSRKRFPVLSLSKALDCLNEGSLPPGSVVLTIDDGWAGVKDRALPILREFRFPVTIYIASYYASKGTPVFRLVLQYLFWKTRERQLSTPGLGVALAPMVGISTKEDRETVVSYLMEHGETQLDETGRCELSRNLAERLHVDYEEITRTRILSLMKAPEIRAAIEDGVDIQLHTHRHRLPLDRDLVKQEIRDNRAFLEPLAGRELRHLCYPSGIWSKEHWPWLEEMGIESATTCVSGHNRSETPKLGLKRFLDGENVYQIEFEAEMYGLTELLRGCRTALKSMFRRRGAAPLQTMKSLKSSPD